MTEEKRGKWIDIAKYGVLGLLILYIAVLLLQSASSNTPFETIEKAVKGTLDVSGMKQADRQELKRFYGLNADDYENVCFYYTNETMGVEELLLVKVKQEEQMDTIEKAVSERIQTQKKSFDGYGEEQMELLSKAVTKRKGDLYLFVVSDKAQQVQSAFLKAL